MRGVLAALLITLGCPAMAAACTCTGSVPYRQLLPASGFDLPVDARIRVFAYDGFPPDLRARLHEEYRLIGPNGAVALRAQLAHTRIDLIPVGGLLPNTAYRLEQRFAYNAAGRRVSDAARMGHAKTNRPPFTHIWYPVRHFMTGDRRSVSPPQPVVLALDSTLGPPTEIAGCGSGTSIWMVVAPPTTSGVIAELRVNGRVVDSRVPTRRTVLIANPACVNSPVDLGARGPYRVEVAFIGPSGARTAAPAITLNGVGEAGRELAAQPAWLAPWFAGEVKPAPPMPRLGPMGCEDGLIADPLRTMAASGGGREPGYPTPLSWTPTGPAALVPQVFPDDRRSVAVRRVDGRTAPIIAPGFVGASAAVGDDTILTVFDAEELSVLRIGPAGAVQWQRRMGEGSAAKVVTCGARAAVAWRRYAQGRPGVGWALLDSETGQPLAHGHAPSSSRPPFEIGCDDIQGVWLAAVETRESISLTRLHPKALSVTLPIAARYSIALAARPGGLLLTGDARIELWRLDRQGQPQGALTWLGDGLRPDIEPFGDYHAVSWETRDQRTALTVIDAAGRHALPRVLDKGLTHPGLVRQPDGLYLVVNRLLRDGPDSVSDAVAIAPIRCARRPMMGAPPRLW